MKKILVIITMTGLCLYPFDVFSADIGAQPQQNMQAPPVAQDLVREGDFAVKLAARLGLGSPTDEASAEAILAQAGIAPLNGWLSDYPVTPQIVGQIQDSIKKASAEGKLAMSSDEATGRMNALAAEERLPVAAYSGGAPGEGHQEPATMPPTVVNNYYYDQGPPIVTYYQPPVAYLYLYDWVPYPAWWFGFWFPGFYISHTFTTVVETGPVVVVNGRRNIITNQIVDPVTRTRLTVSPVVTTRGGRVSPVTTITTGNGNQFRTLSELRQHTGSAVHRNSATGPSYQGPRSGIARDNAVKRGSERYSAPRMSPTPYTAPRLGENGASPRVYEAPAAQDRSTSNGWRGRGEGIWQGPSERWDNTRTNSGERRYSAPGSGSRQFNPAEIRGGGGESRRSPGGNRWQGREGREER